MKWRDFKDELMKDPAVKQAYENLEPEYGLVRALLERRVQKGKQLFF